MHSADVLIVGGGLSGLFAARVLTRAGATVLVLEARDRVGGRTLARPLGGAVYDLGGQWLGPTQERMYALARELGLTPFPTYHEGQKILEVCGRLSRYRSSIPSLPPLSLLLLQSALGSIERLRRRVEPGTLLRAPDAARWDGQTVETWKRRVPSRAVRECFDVAVRTVFGAEAAEVSFLYFLSYAAAAGGMMRLVEIADGAQQDRLVEGAGTVAQRLHAELGDRVRLRTPVLRVEQDAGGVRVHAAAGTFVGRRAILALPPALCGRIAFDPPLPARKDALFQRAFMGGTIKCLALYDRPFWRDEGLSGEVVSGTGVLSAVFDNSPPDGSAGALLGFIVGEAARRWSDRPAPERQKAVLAALARYFGPRAAAPVEYVDMDWCAEPWTRGCPVGNLGPGALPELGALREPAGRLHFAGTETATRWIGYMEGAVEAGERAAEEVRAEG